MAKKCIEQPSTHAIESLKAAIRAGVSSSLNISGSSKHSELTPRKLDPPLNGHSTPKMNGHLKTNGHSSGYSPHQVNGYHNGISVEATSQTNGQSEENDSDNWDNGTECLNPYGMLHELFIH